MTCPVCDRYAPPDPDTGYDGDDVCSTCAAEGFTIGSDGKILWLGLESKRVDLPSTPTGPNVFRKMLEREKDEEDPPCPF